MGVLRFPEWQKACEHAFLEPDPEKLFQRVIVAETAIFHRLHAPANPPGNTELHAIDEALKDLQRLIANAFIPPAGKEGTAGRATRCSQRRPLRANRQAQPFA